LTLDSHERHLLFLILSALSWSVMKLFKIILRGFCTVIIRFTETLITLYLAPVLAALVLHDGLVVWNEAVVPCFAWGV
jgi:hypothetical protein